MKKEKDRRQREAGHRVEASPADARETDRRGHDGGPRHRRREAREHGVREEDAAGDDRATRGSDEEAAKNKIDDRGDQHHVEPRNREEVKGAGPPKRVAVVVMEALARTEEQGSEQAGVAWWVGLGEGAPQKLP